MLQITQRRSIVIDSLTQLLVLPEEGTACYNGETYAGDNGNDVRVIHGQILLYETGAEDREAVNLLRGLPALTWRSLCPRFIVYHLGRFVKFFCVYASFT